MEKNESREERKNWVNRESRMNSQKMTDSSDDSNAVTVHISKHSQVPDGRGGEEREGGKEEGG